MYQPIGVLVALTIYTSAGFISLVKLFNSHSRQSSRSSARLKCHRTWQSTGLYILPLDGINFIQRRDRVQKVFLFTYLFINMENYKLSLIYDSTVPTITDATSEERVQRYMYTVVSHSLQSIVETISIKFELHYSPYLYLHLEVFKMDVSRYST